MPFCAYQDIRMRSDDTVVENAFIREYMPQAPADYAIVYLYGLMQCQNGQGEATPASFARALGRGEKSVREAFAYWQKLGLVEVLEKPHYTVLFGPVSRAMPREEGIYTYDAFNTEVQEIFAPRAPLPQEMSKIYDWLDVFALEQETVPVLLQYARQKMQDIEKATVMQQINYADKIVRQWAEEDITSAEKAREWIELQGDHSLGLSKLMRELGMRRRATAQERKLYEGWLQNGFDQEAISAAAKGMAGIHQPNFKYLDGIINGLRKGGQTGMAAIKENEHLEQLCGEALAALGLKNNRPNASQLRIYGQWAEAGHEHEKILLACEYGKKRDMARMADVGARLISWHEKGMVAVKDIKRLERDWDRAHGDMTEAFVRMGLSKKVSEADIGQYQQWRRQWHMPAELVFLAAEQAHGANYPHRYMQKLLSDWHEKGLLTVKAAKAVAQKQPAPANGGQGYAKHDYEKGQLNELFNKI